MKRILIFLSIILLSFSCLNNKKEIRVDHSTNEGNKKHTTINIQKSSDLQTKGKRENFHEFFEKITWDNHFLISRTQFPIEINGKIKKSKSEWKGISFFKDEEFYTVLNSDTSDKDEIHLNIIHLSNKKALRLNFKNTADNWFLVKVETVTISKLADYEFLAFLRRYSIDSVYQLSHTTFPFVYQSYEGNNYDSLTTELITKDSAVFQNVLENFDNLIFIEEDYKKSDIRTIFFQGRDNGIWVKYYFRKNKKGWLHYRSEDYST